jgi:hypothetical protein
MRVLQITRDEAIADQVHALEFIGCFRHHGRDAVRLQGVDGNDAASGRVQVGPKPERVSFVTDEVVGGVLFA